MFQNDVVGYFSNLWQAARGKGPRMYGKDVFYPLDISDIWKDVDYIKAFQAIPELNAVINLKARSFSNMRLQAVNTKLKPVQDDFVKKLQNPNWFQSEKEFLRQTKIWHEIFGNEYLYLFYGVGFTPADAKGIYTLPPNLMYPELTLEKPFFHVEPDDLKDALKYVMKYDGHELPLSTETIIHLNDNRVVVKKPNQKDLLKGESKLQALGVALNNIRLAYESRGIILKYRGAIGILSNEGKDAAGSVPVDQTEIDRIQKEYSKYGTGSNQHQLLITSASLKWQSMMINNPRNLGLFEEVEEDFNKVLDAFGVPSELVVRRRGSAFETPDQKQANKNFHENTIIPECTEWCYALNQKVYQDTNVKLIPDFSWMPLFQEDLKAKSDTLNQMVNALSKLLMDNQISKEEYREELKKIGIGDGSVVPEEVTTDTQLLETQKAQAQLRGSVGGVQGILGIQTAVSQGTTSPEAGAAILELVYGFSAAEATRLLTQNQNNNGNIQQQEQGSGQEAPASDQSGGE